MNMPYLPILQKQPKFNFLFWLLILFTILILIGIARADISLIKEGMSPNEVNQIMQINPDYEFIRGNFYNTERYFIWQKPKPDFTILKDLYYKEPPKFNSPYLWITFLKNNNEWKVFEIKELFKLSFKPYFGTNGRNFFIPIPKGEVWTFFPNEYNLNWVGLNIMTWFDKCGEPNSFNNISSINLNAEEINWEQLINHIIILESSNNPNAISKDSCIGLMQISPMVLKEYNQNRTKKQKIGKFEIEEVQLYDPVINKIIGTWYLKRIWFDYLPHYKIPQTIETLLIAYNWGIGNLVKWHKQGARWDKLPTETRDYIKKYKKLTKSK